ncbi:MAG TPA: hypothetical protein VKY85_13925 [Candidatus Angelobacter sp.]|nr:hypothetical protein [Candidatus Angelobacter sp.]
MRPFSNSALLDLWERGSGLHPLDQGLLALGWALPGAPGPGPADWPLGRRNKLLLDLHSSFFGPTLEGWSACGVCGEKMEFAIDGRTLAGDAAAETNSDVAVHFKGQSFRLPSSRDLAEAARQTDTVAAVLCLIRRCNSGPQSGTEWKAADVEEIGERMAQADPLAEIRLSLKCPACGQQSTETIEIAGFLWSKIEAQAKRMIWEVHTLAAAYGWSEQQILSMSPARRSRYLEMVHT